MNALHAGTLSYPFVSSVVSLEGSELDRSAFEVREPSGDRLVSQQRPCVSTREYGGLECPGERGSTGDMAEMVMAKQRDSRALVKFATSLRWSCFYEAAFSSTYRASSSH